MSDVGIGAAGQILQATTTGTKWVTYSSVVNYIDAVLVATTAALTASYNNGVAGVGAFLLNTGALAAFSVDGQTPAINSRVLVKDQGSTLQNGVYILTTVGSGAVAWVLTRSTDFDEPSEINVGDVVPVQTGTVNANTTWLQGSTVTAVGTDPITFTQFSSAPLTLPVSLANGGTNANLTASNGGIFYSTGSAGAILSGTATAGQILRSGASTTPGWSTATYPSTAGTSGKVLISDGTNIVSSTPTFPNASASSGKFIRSDGTNWIASTPTLPTSAGTSGKVLQSDGTNYVESTPTYPSASGTAGQILRSDGTNNLYTTSTYPNTNAVSTLLYASSTNVMGALTTANNGTLVTSATGVPSILAGPGTSGNILQSNASAAPSFSTPTYPSASGTAGKIIISDGTNNIYSTPTYPNTSGTSGKVLISDGTNNVYSTPTFPNASASSGKFIRSDGTNWIASTPTLPTSAGTAGKILVSDATNYIESTPTFPNASATTRKMIVSDGTNWVASTETWAVPGTSGNVLTSDGTNWVSSAAAGDFSPNSTVQIFDDFIGLQTASSVITSQLIWNVQNPSGTPSSTFNSSNTGLGSGNPGVVVNVGGFTSGTEVLQLFQNGSSTANLVVGGGVLDINWVVKIATLSTSTNRYKFFCGILNPVLSSLTDGVYFTYSDNLNSGNWVGNTSKASSNSTANSSTAVVNNAFVNLRISVNAAATSCSFFVNGTEIANSPLSTNIPTSVNLCPALGLVWSAGTIGTSSVIVDLFYMNYALTTPR